jgi:hypothetical protein
MTGRALLFVLLPLLVLGAGDRALACSCMQRTKAEHLESSDAAFDAVVIKVRHVRFKIQEPDDGRPYAVRGERVELRVTKWLKGPHAEGSIVRFATVTECCVCGVSVRKGQRWRIFVSGKEPYDLSLCSGSHLLEGNGAK